MTPPLIGLTSHPSSAGGSAADQAPAQAASIREENLEGGSMNKSMIPMLTNSIQRGRPLRLPSSSTSADIKGLSDLLGLTSPGHLMSVPIITPDKEAIGGILVLSPCSNRLWSAEDQAFLANIATALVPIIQRGQRMNALEHKSELTKAELDVAQVRIADLERRNNDLIKQMEAVKTDAQDGLAQAENLAELTRMQEEAQKAIEKLKAENESLRASKGIKVGSKVNTQVESELRSTLEEVARLQNPREQAALSAACLALLWVGERLAVRTWPLRGCRKSGDYWLAVKL